MTSARWMLTAPALMTALACSSVATKPTNVGEGGTCADDSECASKSCLGGFCGGAHCTCNALGMCYRSGDCSTGWVCPDATVLHGGTCRIDCAMSASACPKGYSCVADGSGMSCVYGGGGSTALTVNIVGVSAIRHGAPIVLHADVASSSPPVTITWTLVNIDTSASMMVLGTGPDLNVKLMPAAEVDHLGVRVDATDASGASSHPAGGLTYSCTSTQGTACATSIATFCCNAACDTGTMTCP